MIHEESIRARSFRSVDEYRLQQNDEELQRLRWKATCFQFYDCAVGRFPGCENWHGWEYRHIKAAYDAKYGVGGEVIMLRHEEEVQVDMRKTSYLFQFRNLSCTFRFYHLGIGPDDHEAVDLQRRIAAAQQRRRIAGFSYKRLQVVVQWFSLLRLYLFSEIVNHARMTKQFAKSHAQFCRQLYII